MKHVKNSDIIIHPERGSKEQHIPSKGLIFVNSSEIEIFKRKYVDHNWHRNFLPFSSLYVNKHDNFFIAGPCLGAPAAVLCLEKLIALGADEITVFGWAGTISDRYDIGDLFVPERAYSGEGTSSYYGCNLYSQPSINLSHKMRKHFDNSQFEYHLGNSWSTDAPYRESRKMLFALNEKYTIEAIDMEVSALCAVSEFRGISLMATFIISDLLYKKEWVAGYKSNMFRKKRSDIVENLLGYFQKKKE